MKSVISVLALLIAIVPLQSAEKIHPYISSSSSFGDQVITHIADGGDWKTSITLFNLSNIRPVTFTLKFYNDSGNSQTFPFKNVGTFSELTGVIAVNGSVSVETVGYSSSSTMTGWAYLDSNDSIGGFAIFGNKNGQEATVPIESWIDSKEILSFDNSSGNVMGMALVNPRGSSVAHVTVVFYDRNGGEIARDTILMDANAHVSYVMPQKWPVLAGRVGTVNISTDGYGVAVLGLRFSPRFAFTSVIPVRPTSI